MRICDNGIYRDATPEEIAEREMEAAQQIQVAEPTQEERMEQIEAALIELAAMMAGGA